VTERRRAEHALREAQAALAHVTRVTTLGEVTASIAHEINQPIAAAITDASTCVRWLSRTEPDLDEARQAAQRTVKDATRAADIITRIRRLFKRSGLDAEPVNVNDVVEELITLLRREALRSGVSITTALAPDLPLVMGDRVQLQQVLLNLLMNSIEATKRVGDRLEITVTSRRADGDEVHVAVTDTGVGLPPTGADELFKAFFTTKAGGTGMGLANQPLHHRRARGAALGRLERRPRRDLHLHPAHRMRRARVGGPGPGMRGATSRNRRADPGRRVVEWSRGLPRSIESVRPGKDHVAVRRRTFPRGNVPQRRAVGPARLV
jgi:hypothetical protein